MVSKKNNKNLSECLDFIEKTKNGDFATVNMESVRYARLKPQTIKLAKQYYFSVR